MAIIKMNKKKKQKHYSVYGTKCNQLMNIKLSDLNVNYSTRDVKPMK